MQLYSQEQKNGSNLGLINRLMAEEDMCIHTDGQTDTETHTYQIANILWIIEKGR